MSVRPGLSAVLCVVTLACGSSTQAPTPITPATPAPTPVPTPAPFVCPLPALPDLHNQCPKLTPRLQEFVENAIQRVIREHPEVFDLSDDLGGGSFKVRDRERYHALVLEAIHAQGVCGIVEKEEVAVKNSNAFNEQYNIWVSSGYIRHGPRSYITTCFPAQF